MQATDTLNSIPFDQYCRNCGLDRDWVRRNYVMVEKAWRSATPIYMPPPPMKRYDRDSEV